MKIFNLNANNFGGPYDTKPKKKDLSWGEYNKVRYEFEQQGLNVLKSIINAIDIEKPDIVIFQEFDVNSPAGKEVSCLLAEPKRGYKQIFPNGEKEISGNYSITMMFVRNYEIMTCESPKVMEYRWCGIKIGDLTIMGVHAPLESDFRKKEDVQKFFYGLKEYAKNHKYENVIILGDLNCHRGEASSHKNDLVEMEKHLYDLVKDTDVTYFPGGTTIDHVLVSPLLKDKVIVEVKTQSEYKLSDHAVIIVEIKD